MLGILKGFFTAKAKIESTVATQPPGEVFPWPKGVRLVALEETVIAIPYAVLSPNEPIGSVIRSSSDDLGIQIPPDPKASSVLFLKMKEGMAVSITKSCQAYIVSSDPTPKRIRIEKPEIKKCA